MSYNYQICYNLAEIRLPHLTMFGDEYTEASITGTPFSSLDAAVKSLSSHLKTDVLIMEQSDREKKYRVFYDEHTDENVDELGAVLMTYYILHHAEDLDPEDIRTNYIAKATIRNTDLPIITINH